MRYSTPMVEFWPTNGIGPERKWIDEYKHQEKDTYQAINGATREAN